MYNISRKLILVKKTKNMNNNIEGAPNPMDSVPERGKFSWADPKSGIMHFFATQEEKADFIAEQRENE